MSAGTTVSRAAGREVEPHPLRARRVRFDWHDTPLHWIPGDPQTTHTINVLHLLLPAGERWFVDVYRQALPLVTDERVRADVRGFMGQEAVHARAHAAVLDHLAEQHLDPSPFTRHIEWLFARLLGDRPLGFALPGALARIWLVDRLSIIAAIEHFTAVLGRWILDADALVDAGSDPTMLDLLRWHGAEEVEHRAVAFDLFDHVSGAYWRRVVAMALVAPILAALWIEGTRFFLRHDPLDPGPLRFTALVRAGRRRRLPTLSELGRAVPRFLRHDYHPSQEGSTAQALAYLATSPAVLGAGAARDT